MVCHHRDKFVGHRHCGNEDIMFLICHAFGPRHCDSGNIMVLICHMISQDHLTKQPCKFCGRSPSR